MIRPGRAGRHWPENKGALVEDLIVMGTDGKMYRWDAGGSFILIHTCAHVPVVNGNLICYADKSIMGVFNTLNYFEWYRSAVWGHLASADRCGCSSHSGSYTSGATWCFLNTSWFRWTGAAWVTNNNLPAVALTGSAAGNCNCWAASDLDCWVSCEGNLLYRTTDGGTTWTNYTAQVLADTGTSLSGNSGIWGFNANSVYVCDSNRSRLLRWNGANFSAPMTSLQYPHMVWGNSPNNLFVNGRDGSANFYMYRYLNGVKSTVANTPVLSFTARRLMGTMDGKRLIAVLGNNKSRVSADGGATWAAPHASMPATVIEVGAVGV